MRYGTRKWQGSENVRHFFRGHHPLAGFNDVLTMYNIVWVSIENSIFAYHQYSFQDTTTDMYIKYSNVNSQLCVSHKLSTWQQRRPEMAALKCSLLARRYIHMQICLPCQRILTPPACPRLQVPILQWSMPTDTNCCTLHVRTVQLCIISQQSHDETTDLTIQHHTHASSA